jgi:hypothetical protein
MDFIRFEVLSRSNLYENTFRKRMFPVIGSKKFIYKKPLMRWTKFNITLVLEGWDEKWVYHRQTFTQGDEVAAIGFTKIAFWEDKKAQNLSKIIRDCGVQIAEMKPSSEILKMFENDSEITKSTTNDKII